MIAPLSVRVLLADDHPFVRRGVRETIEEAGAGRVVAEASDGEEALRLVRELGEGVDVVVVDLSMPKADGLEVVSRLQAERPGLPVLVLSMHPPAAVAVQAIQAGAAGYLSKRDAPDHIAAAVTAAVAGRRYLTPEAAGVLAMQAVPGAGEGRLTVRELQVVRALASGRSRAEAAAELGIAPTTVSAYKGRAKRKLGAQSDADLVRAAIEHGMVE